MSMDAEHIVRDWQRPFYNLAYRMLGNEADAADATQEIFIQIFRGMKSYDTAREFRPWAYRIATNAILHYIRDRKLRHERENEAAMERDGQFDPHSAKSQAEKREMEALFAQKLAQLPESERSLLVLHYYQELPQTEIAAALDIPRTTIQSRLEKALGSLRKSLAGAGVFAAVPEIELLMKSAASLPVPTNLAGSLATLAAQTGTLATGAGLTIGGILVTKQAVLGATFIGLLSLGAGFWVGTSLGSGDADAAKKTSVALANETEANRQRQEKEQLASRIAQLEEENHKLLAQAAARESLPKTAQALTTEIAKDEPSPVPASAPLASKRSLDWSRFAELLAKNIDAMLATFEAEKAGDGQSMSKEEQAKLQEVIMEFSKLATEARELSDTPILEAEIAKGLVGAIFEKTLGLSSAQADALRQAVDHSLAQARSQLDGTDTLPSQYFLARTDLLNGIESHLDSAVSESQKERWSKLAPASQMMLRGDSSICQIGMNLNGASPATEVANRWKKAFSLDSEQEGAVRSLAPEFVKEAQSILAKYGQTDTNASKLSSAERYKMNSEFLAAQIRMEKRFAYLLTPQQKKALASRMPTILQFVPGGDMNTSTHRGPGF